MYLTFFRWYKLWYLFFLNKRFDGDAEQQAHCFLYTLHALKTTVRMKISPYFLVTPICSLSSPVQSLSAPVHFPCRLCNPLPATVAFLVHPAIPCQPLDTYPVCHCKPMSPPVRPRYVNNCISPTFIVYLYSYYIQFYTKNDI